MIRTGNLVRAQLLFSGPRLQRLGVHRHVGTALDGGHREPTKPLVGHDDHTRVHDRPVPTQTSLTAPVATLKPPR
jgi:hypothetical protein